MQTRSHFWLSVAMVGFFYFAIEVQRTLCLVIYHEYANSPCIKRHLNYQLENFFLNTFEVARMACTSQRHKNYVADSSYYELWLYKYEHRYYAPRTQDTQSIIPLRIFPDSFSAESKLVLANSLWSPAVWLSIIASKRCLLRMISTPLRSARVIGKSSLTCTLKS